MMLCDIDSSQVYFSVKHSLKMFFSLSPFCLPFNVFVRLNRNVGKVEKIGENFGRLLDEYNGVSCKGMQRNLNVVVEKDF